MDRIRQALNRAHSERASSPERDTPDLGLIRFQTLPPPALNASQLEALGNEWAAETRPSGDGPRDSYLPEELRLEELASGDPPLALDDSQHEALADEFAAQPPPSDSGKIDSPTLGEVRLDQVAVDSDPPLQSEALPQQPAVSESAALAETSLIWAIQADSAVFQTSWSECPSTERPSAAGLHRLSTYAPVIVSALLGVLLTVELAHAALLLFNGNPPKAPQAPLVARASTAPVRPRIDVPGIVAAHLFGEAVKVSSLGGRPTEANPNAKMLLAGTLAMESPNGGLAIISVDGRSTMYRVGDSVTDANLQSVFYDHVVLDRGGMLETLVFPQKRVPGKADGPVLPAPAVAVQTPQPPDPPRAGVPSAGEVMRGVASVGSDGIFRGFRVFPTASPKKFAAQKLRPGDLVVAVNGNSLASQDAKSAQAIFDSLKTSSKATLTVVERASGETHEVTVDPSQEEADPDNN